MRLFHLVNKGNSHDRDGTLLVHGYLSTHSLEVAYATGSASAYQETTLKNQV